MIETSILPAMILKIVSFHVQATMRDKIWTPIIFKIVAGRTNVSITSVEWLFIQESCHKQYRILISSGHYNLLLARERVCIKLE